MMFWKTHGDFLCPNDILTNLKVPLPVSNTKYHYESISTGICQKTLAKSSLVIYPAPSTICKG